jgi:nitrite reductase/ring-hydroxylating ferredoxin subunit
LFIVVFLLKKNNAVNFSVIVLLEFIGVAIMSVAGWLGGTLVYRNQIGVDHRYADAGKWQEKTLPPAAGGEAVDVGAADDLEVNQMALLHVGDRRVVLARTEDGVVAFDDRCTHRGGPLSDGTLACGTVQCPWHGSQFDVRTGQPVHGPAEAPVQVHEVSERGGRLLLRLAD